MKKSILIAFILASFVAFFYSCDKIEGPYMNEDIVVFACDTPDFPALGDVYRKILLEEYTGHTCVNCPDGHLKASNLKTKYGDSIVIIAIHAGLFAEPESPEFPADYRTIVGTTLNDGFGVQGYPSGMVSRLPFASSMVMDRSACGIAAKAIDKNDPAAAIQLALQYDGAEQKACVASKVTFLKNIAEEVKLAIYMIEDNIISPQKNAFASIGEVPIIHNYQHNHMLRASLNSPWGETVSQSSAEANQTLLKVHGFSFEGKGFNPQNCSFVAVLYNAETYEVIQTEEISL